MYTRKTDKEFLYEISSNDFGNSKDYEVSPLHYNRDYIALDKMNSTYFKLVKIYDYDCIKGQRVPTDSWRLDMYGPGGLFGNKVNDFHTCMKAGKKFIRDSLAKTSK